MRRPSYALLILLPLALAGCDQLGIESAASVAARREAEGKAVGGGCRHAARSVEQCYAMNKRADKASVFAGWREMNDYMRENKIEAMPAPPEPPVTEVAAADDTADAAAGKGDKAEPADKPAKGATKTDKADKAEKVAAKKH